MSTQTKTNKNVKSILTVKNGRTSVRTKQEEEDEVVTTTKTPPSPAVYIKQEPLDSSPPSSPPTAPPQTPHSNPFQPTESYPGTNIPQDQIRKVDTSSPTPFARHTVIKKQSPSEPPTTPAPKNVAPTPVIGTIQPYGCRFAEHAWLGLTPCPGAEGAVPNGVVVELDKEGRQEVEGMLKRRC